VQKTCGYFVIHECRENNKARCITKYKYFILCLVCCLVYPICLGCTAFLTRRIYGQSIQRKMNSEFSALNAINALYEICTSYHNTCNTWEDCNYYLLLHIYIYHFHSLIKLYKHILQIIMSYINKSFYDLSYYDPKLPYISTCIHV